MLPEAQLSRLEAALDRFAGLDALWLFGSEAGGRATSRSDVDLAALFATRPSPEELLGAREEVQEIAGRAVDLVDLERASPILAMQALKHGRVVADRNPAHRIRFMAALPGRYEDVVILRRPGERLRRASWRMVERDVVVAKAGTIERCLARVAEVRSRPPGALLPVDVEDIVVLNVTRAAQAAADLAAHVVAAEGLGLPDSLAAGFTLLERHGIIDATMAGKLRGAMGFRNVAVHSYETVDRKVVEAIATHHVEDLRRFAGVMVERYAK